MITTAPLNIVELETTYGYRAFELYQCDITELPFPIDILVVSAYQGGYSPTKGTLIGALQEKTVINLELLSQKPQFDFRTNLGCWMTDCNLHPNIDRILCCEILGSTISIEDLLENVFITASIAEMKGIVIKTMALPVLGAGHQNIDPKSTIDMLLPRALSYLRRSSHTTKIVFVEISPERAALLNQAMNDTLGRVKIVLPKGELTKSIRTEIQTELNKLRHSPLSQSSIYDDIQRIIRSDSSRSFEIGIVSRRLAETIVDFVHPSKGVIDLYGKIEGTAQIGVAPWIRSYMHVLRVFGNESAHEQNRNARTPSNLEGADLSLCFFCLLRVLVFYREWHHSSAPSQVYPNGNSQA